MVRHRTRLLLCLMWRGQAARCSTSASEQRPSTGPEARRSRGGRLANRGWSVVEKARDPRECGSRSSGGPGVAAAGESRASGDQRPRHLLLAVERRLSAASAPRRQRFDRRGADQPRGEPLFLDDREMKGRPPVFVRSIRIEVAPAGRKSRMALRSPSRRPKHVCRGAAAQEESRTSRGVAGRSTKPSETSLVRGVRADGVCAGSTARHDRRSPRSAVKGEDTRVAAARMFGLAPR